MADPAVAKAISDSSEIVLALSHLMPGRSVLAFYLALLRLAKTMEVRYEELRRVRDSVLEPESVEERECN